MPLALASLLGGLLLLYKGADWLVSGSSSLARRLGIKPIIVGLTVVAFGTSAPEMFVNLTASLEGKADIAMSNIIGSNIANVLLILGIVALVRPLILKSQTVSREIPIALLASALVWILASDRLLVGGASNGLNRIDGLILLAFFAAFLYYVVSVAVRERGAREEKARAIGISIGLSALGLFGLALGGKLTIDGASALAAAFGLSERFIGLTIVAIGTSLPELLTSVVAAMRKHGDLAIGNIIGSNIFNVFWILGLSAVIKRLPATDANRHDVLVAVAATALLLVFSLIGKKFVLERWQGAILLLVYATYIGVLALAR
jgi:cation:H+ antiporter